MASCSDELVWHIICHGYCSYRVKTLPNNMCRNPNNLTGLCNHMNCPLANSRYATVLEENGKLYLMTKTIERAHMPSKMWEKSELSTDLKKAMEQINNKLAYWPNHIVAKCKARYVKLTQMLIRMRRIELQPSMDIRLYHKKTERRDAARARKAEAAAMIEQQIKKELFSRLLKGTYPTEMIDLDQGVKDLVAKHLEGTLPTEEEQRERAQQRKAELEDEIDSTMTTEYVEGDFESDAEDADTAAAAAAAAGGAMPDLEDLVPSTKRRRASESAAGAAKKRGAAKKPRRPHIEIEYENEHETQTNPEELE